MFFNKNMIQKEDLDKILNFVASRWDAAVKEPDNKAMEGLPNQAILGKILYLLS